MTADIYFDQRKFSQAVQSYEKYLNLYPYKQRDYALYQIGLSYKNQLPNRSEHDLSLSASAIKAFNALLKSKSPYKQKALTAKQENFRSKSQQGVKNSFIF